MSIATQETSSFQKKPNGSPPAVESPGTATAQDALALQASTGSASPPDSQQVADAKTTPVTEKIRREAATLRNAVAFTQVVGILMRSPHYRQFTIGDLEWLVVPPVSAGQFRVGEVKPKQARSRCSAATRTASRRCTC